MVKDQEEFLTYMELLCFPGKLQSLLKIPEQDCRMARLNILTYEFVSLSSLKSSFPLCPASVYEECLENIGSFTQTILTATAVNIVASHSCYCVFSLKLTLSFSIVFTPLPNQHSVSAPVVVVSAQPASQPATLLFFWFSLLRPPWTESTLTFPTDFLFKDLSLHCELLSQEWSKNVFTNKQSRQCCSLFSSAANLFSSSNSQLLPVCLLLGLFQDSSGRSSSLPGFISSEGKLTDEFIQRQIFFRLLR